MANPWLKTDASKRREGLSAETGTFGGERLSLAWADMIHMSRARPSRQLSLRRLHEKTPRAGIEPGPSAGHAEMLIAMLWQIDACGRPFVSSLAVLPIASGSCQAATW